MRFGPVFISFVFLCAISKTAVADIRLDLTSPTTDPTMLRVGEPVTFSVVLSGLPPGESLVSLSATVAFDENSLAAPAIFSGPIVPATLSDPFDYVSLADAGLVDATFLTFSSSLQHQIVSDGVFYTFQVTPEHLGEATIHLDFVDASLFDPGNPNLPLPVDVVAGSSLAVTVAVPEPDTIGLLIAGGLGYLASRLRRRRAQSRTERSS